MPISSIVLDYVASNFEAEMVSTTLAEEVKRPLTMDLLLKNFNDTIQNDRDNAFKLRGYLHKAT
ncbi:hypothetical protein BOTBODRAFT_37982 [Botryobasidium botryosum FD-172 SS1]|uniref:Uncharacterized protein n=1 Tax=Botryobasidium botryosum (strain FD-172 SS1) TaxID=930990 RepID=A0A067M148_BOTB1|nr:hypothetical protein BOTBODRAFT_37982 [Botryobasidium botryosum FD-172 SS1]